MFVGQGEDLNAYSSGSTDNAAYFGSAWTSAFPKMPRTLMDVFDLVGVAGLGVLVEACAELPLELPAPGVCSSTSRRSTSITSTSTFVPDIARAEL